MSKFKIYEFNNTKLLLFIFSFLSLIIFRDILSKSILDSLNYCVFTLFPSLFPSVFLSVFFFHSNSCKYFSKLFAPIISKVFGLPSCCTAAFISALLFGYPMGAKLSSYLTDKKILGQNEAFRLFSCCLSPGLSFCVLFIGGKILKDIRTGIFMFLSIVISNLMLLLLSRKKTPASNHSGGNEKKSGIYENLNTSLRSAADSLFVMTYYIILFRAASDLLFNTGIYDIIVKSLFFIPPMLKAFAGCFFLEVTSGVSYALKIDLSLRLITAGLAFGGLSVFFQAFSFFKAHNFRLIKLIAIRLSASLLSYIIFSLFKIMLPDFFIRSIAVSSSMHHEVSMQNNFLSITFFTLLFFFYITVKEEKQNSTKL